MFLLMTLVCCSLQLEGAVLTDVDNRGTAAQDTFSLSGNWQLFVDDYLVEQKDNSVRRTYHAFEKHARNPVIIADKPWEGKMAYLFGTVMPKVVGHGYRMWYQSWNGEYVNLYATSEDGIHWDKPELGIVNYNGTTNNNIFFRATGEDALPQVIYSPWEVDTTKRYKFLLYEYGRTPPSFTESGFLGAYSADGIRWTLSENNPVLRDRGDVGSFVWDGHMKRYSGYTKIFVPVRGFNRRCVGYTATTDFEHWPSAQLILVPDETDDHWVEERNQRTEFYGLTAFPYESGYIGFLWIFKVTDGDNDGPIYCELVSSRDGINWVRQEVQGGSRAAILPLGTSGTWDAGMVFTPSYPIVEGGQIKLWYGGSNVTHKILDSTAYCSIGLATLRKDGFASLSTNEVGGSVMTKPLKNMAGHLFLNVNASKGSVKVELLSADGKVIPGYSQYDCNEITGDNVAVMVKWGDEVTLPKTYSALKLRIILQNASVYSFNAGPNVDVVDAVAVERLLLDFAQYNEGHTSQDYRMFGDVYAADDVYNDGKKAIKAMRFESSDTLLDGNKMELLKTDYLGPVFTLAAVIKSDQDIVSRLFSNYRGVGDITSGELIFDFDPSGISIPGLRFIVNGQTVLSDPIKFDDGKYHSLAATYDHGKVTLYLDGVEVGSKLTKLGATHLNVDNTALTYFDEPHALPEVGIQLGSNLCLGGDLGGRFLAYRTETIPPAGPNFSGYMYKACVVREVLSPAALQQLLGD